MSDKKSIEQRIEELENLVYLNKNVLSFEEACKFTNLSKSYLYKLLRLRPRLVRRQTIIF